MRGGETGGLYRKGSGADGGASQGRRAHVMVCTYDKVTCAGLPRGEMARARAPYSGPLAAIAGSRRN
jgi:hypothetical protein